MWHEARKQERKIRGIMVDYKKRAERRRDFYEKIKADPTQFLQLHGRPVKIHLDPAVAMAADSPANMMPWQGHSDILIDRFDVRAHLDHIPEYPQKTDVPEGDELSREDRLANYERYRIIVQNDFLGVGEEKFLHQLYLEEQFGPVVRPLEGDKKKRNAEKNSGAAIPYTYDENSGQDHGENGDDEAAGGDEDKEEEEEEDDSDIDFDLCVDVTQVGPQQAHEMNLCGSAYGMTGTDFYTFLLNDIEEKESLRQAREQEEEKAMYSGRKSRRERRAFREKRLQGRKISPPSYAARMSPTYDAYRKSPSKSRSRSRSHSPLNAGQITYITSFGGEEDDGTAGGGAGAGASIPSNKSQTSAAVGLVPPQAKACRSRSPHGRSGYRYRSRGRDRSHSPSSRSRRRHDSPPRSRHRSRSRDRGSSSSKYYRNKSPHSSEHRNRSRRRHSSSSDKSSRSRSPGKARQASRSKSPTNNNPPPPPLKRYYGSRKVESSSSEFGDSDSDSKNESSSVTSVGASTSVSEKKPSQNKTMSTGFGNSGAGTKPQQKFTPQERLKKKMQVLLNRQFKADKRAERMRHEKQEQERQDREDELREMAIKLRRRERERRHRMQDDDEFEEEEEKANSDSSHSYSPSGSPSPPRNNTSSHRRNRWDQSGDVSERPPRHRDRSRTPSPDRRPRQRPLVDY